MQVKMHAAKSQLSKLVEAAERGEEVILARGDRPVAKIVPLEQTRPKPFVYDILAHLVKGPIPDFEPMSDEELDQLEREKEERIASSLAGHERVDLEPDSQPRVVASSENSK